MYTGRFTIRQGKLPSYIFINGLRCVKVNFPIYLSLTLNINPKTDLPYSLTFIKVSRELTVVQPRLIQFVTYLVHPIYSLNMREIKST